MLLISLSTVIYDNVLKLRKEYDMLFRVYYEDTNTEGYISTDKYMITTEIKEEGGYRYILVLSIKTELDTRKLHLGAIDLSELFNSCGRSLDNYNGYTDYKMFANFVTEFICTKCKDFVNIFENLKNEYSDTRQDLKKFIKSKYDMLEATKQMKAIKERRTTKT